MVEKMNPDSSVKPSYFSQITFSLFSPISKLAQTEPLSLDDICDLDKSNQAETAAGQFSKHFKCGKESCGILYSLLNAFWRHLVCTSFLKLIGILLKFANPFLLDYLLSFISTTDQPLWLGYFYAVLMFLTSALASVVNSQYELRMSLTIMRVRSCITSIIYSKSLRLASSSSVTESVNLMAVHTSEVIDSLEILDLVWSTPLEIVIALYMLWSQLGVATLAGFAVMLILLPTNIFITTKLRGCYAKIAVNKEKRNQMMNEVLNGIRFLKLFAWENIFLKGIRVIRANEVSTLRRQAYLQTAMIFSIHGTLIFVALAVFITYVLMDVNNVLDANKVFVSLALFNALRQPFGFIPRIITSLLTAWVSMKRLNRYLICEELNTHCIGSENTSETSSVKIVNGSFTWSKSEAPLLHNINVNIKPNRLIAVVGSVGSGKSSFLSAILGEMNQVSGSVVKRGTIAYMPQQAWMKNETVRQNILFTKPMVESRYRKILTHCALKPDLEVLDGGDLCEIGEKGVTLSGGQKQRISLARAAYFDADIYLFDDPLSSVDAHVGRQLFDEVIGPRGLLKSKTRILVTHEISILPQVDEIIVFKNGRISERGSYVELLKTQGDFSEILLHCMDGKFEGSEDDENENRLNSFQRQVSFSATSNVSDAVHGSSLRRRKARTISETSDTLRRSRTDSKLYTVDDVKKPGSIDSTVYKEYICAMGLSTFFFTLFTFTLSTLFQVITDLWLADWSNDGSIPGRTQDLGYRDYRLIVYAFLSVTTTVFLMASGIAMNQICITASATIHDTMLNRLIHAPISFFDTTPFGDILYRFLNDIHTADFTMRMSLRSFVMFVLKGLATVGIVTFRSPFFVVAFIPLSIVYRRLQVSYVSVSTQLRRLEADSRSPIFSHFSETIAGLSSVRAYNVEKQFIKVCHQLVDSFHKCYLASVIANEWLSIRLDFLGYTTAFFATLFAVSSRGTISPGVTGLCITYAFTFSSILSMLVRASSNLETNFVAVERCLEFWRLPTEEAEDDDKKRVRSTWPESGHIKFVEYTTKYRKDLCHVLKRISFEIKPREKVGIIGRTGAGKSSLVMALFRLIEPTEGSIIIDDVDITSIRLEDLRSRLTIIPQDPFLFTGTLRYNLDPDEKYSIEEIWRALRLVSLEEHVKSLNEGLSYLIVEEGDNLSAGQRQQICLARAILRRSKILILDEATAAVDYETDSLIQEVIRSEFKECTVLTIAHRLNTVIDYDRLLVLSEGEIVEFDTPSNLLENKGSMFYDMAKDAGLIS